jgi:hypothetical protein
VDADGDGGALRDEDRDHRHQRLDRCRPGRPGRELG